MASSPSHERKRPRSLSADEESDHDTRSHRLEPAERKRVLERNRRNLVNVRFAELEAELRNAAPRADPSGMLYTPRADGTPVSQCPTRSKRIDKEAVLKEAATRVCVQRKDLALAMRRMETMTAEIATIRAEKLELREDKGYLRKELETVRKEVVRLREDNINLWQAVRKASSIKEALNADLTKVPVSLFAQPGTGLQQQVPLAASDGTSVTRVQTTQAMPSPPNLGPISPNAQEMARKNAQMHRQSQLHQVRAIQARQKLATITGGDSPISQRNDVLSTRAPDLTTGLPTPVDQPQASPYQRDLFGSQFMGDSFLMCAGAEDLSDLFSNYVPGAASQAAQNNPQIEPDKAELDIDQFGPTTQNMNGFMDPKSNDRSDPQREREESAMPRTPDVAHAV